MSKKEKDLLIKWLQRTRRSQNLISMYRNMLKYKKEMREFFKDSELKLCFESYKILPEYDIAGCFALKESSNVKI